jgi:hypothetical protein
MQTLIDHREETERDLDGAGGHEEVSNSMWERTVFASRMRLSKLNQIKVKVNISVTHVSF